VDGALHRIETTFEHPFWVDGKAWTAARDLALGDTLVGDGNKPLAVVSLRGVPGDADVYNFRVDGFHSYFVGENGVGFTTRTTHRRRRRRR